MLLATQQAKPAIAAKLAIPSGISIEAGSDTAAEWAAACEEPAADVMVGKSATPLCRTPADESVAGLDGGLRQSATAHSVRGIIRGQCDGKRASGNGRAQACARIQQEARSRKRGPQRRSRQSPRAVTEGGHRRSLRAAFRSVLALHARIHPTMTTPQARRPCKICERCAPPNSVWTRL